MRGWLRVGSAGEYSDSCPRTVRSWLKKGLRHVRVNGTGAILIKVEWLDQYLESFEVNENQVEEIVAEIEKEMNAL